jgi:hypothetical protein
MGVSATADPYVGSVRYPRTAGVHRAREARDASAPTQTERVTSRVRVDLEALGRRGVVGRFQESRAPRDGFLMRGREVVDPQVEMDLLLRRPVGPSGGHMVRRELHAQPPLAVDHHAVSLVVRFDRAAQQTCPEGALGGQIGGVEHNDLPRDLHAVLLGTTRYDASALKSIDQCGATLL